MVEGSFECRPAKADELHLFAEWAAAEGWNPGGRDLAGFAPVDPDGFLVGVLDGRVIACISVVRYGTDFAFLGFYIADPEFRGRGYGLRLWQTGIAHAGGRRIGLDGVVAQQANYAESGFSFHWNNARFSGPVDGSEPVVPQGSRLVPMGPSHLPALTRFDRRSFPTVRPAFLSRWATLPGHKALVLEQDGSVEAVGVARPCREGMKIGPLHASNRASATAVVSGLAAAVPAKPSFLDVPLANPEAVGMARELGMEPVFETARMWTGERPELDLTNLYGVMSFELG